MQTKYAAKITDKSIPSLVKFAEMNGLNLDYIKDTMKFNAEEFGEDTYLLVFNPESRTSLYFNEMTGTEFRRLYRFTHRHYHYILQEIEKI